MDGQGSDFETSYLVGAGGTVAPRHFYLPGLCPNIHKTRHGNLGTGKVSIYVYCVFYFGVFQLILAN